MILLWGDSHATSILPAFSKYVKENGAQVLFYSMGGCKPYFSNSNQANIVRANATAPASACDLFNRAVIDSLPELKFRGLSVVALAAYWSHPNLWLEGLG